MIRSARRTYGPRAVHPTAGAVAVGARRPLIAFNVYLGTADPALAKSIAKAIRHSSGGLRYVKALGLEIAGSGTTQVSMNLTNFKATSIVRVMDLIHAEAARWGIPVVAVGGGRIDTAGRDARRRRGVPPAAGVFARPGARAEAAE